MVEIMKETYGRKFWLMVNKKEVNLELNNSKLKKLKNSRLTSGQWKDEEKRIAFFEVYFADLVWHII